MTTTQNPNQMDSTFAWNVFLFSHFIHYVKVYIDSRTHRSCISLNISTSSSMNLQHIKLKQLESNWILKHSWHLNWRTLYTFDGTTINEPCHIYMPQMLFVGSSPFKTFCKKWFSNIMLIEVGLLATNLMLSTKC
jgi:hypothetical protein